MLVPSYAIAIYWDVSEQTMKRIDSGFSYLLLISVNQSSTSFIQKRYAYDKLYF